MGQTLSLATLPGGSVGIDVPELADLSYEKTLGTARLMKCLRARHQDGLVAVKLVMKPFAGMEFKSYVKAIRNERRALFDVPNALGYQRVIETTTAGYLARQYIYSSLYDRMSTRPFLEEIEKKWLAFQLLCALRDSHACEVYHGDIKTENILVTSWNWLYLTDYSASYKPTRLPEDNPADFSFYFDTSGRRTCYLAPERFMGSVDQDDKRGLTWAMDVFSAGCVIAELFTETPIFNLSQLFKYRAGEYDPSVGYLDRVHDPSVKEMIAHMIQVEPDSRYSAEEYLQFWKGKAFPEYFYNFLHQYMGTITDPSSGRTAVQPGTENFGESDDRIDRVYHDFDKIAYFLDFDNHEDVQSSNTAASTPEGGDSIPIRIDIPSHQHYIGSTSDRRIQEGSLLFLTLVVSSLRHTARASARIRACDLLLAFAERVTDEAILDRILPYVVALLNDCSDNVKVAALRTMTQLLSMVKVVSPINAYVFTDYVVPRLQQFLGGSDHKTAPFVRAAYASYLASLAHSSSRLLDTAQIIRADGSVPAIDHSIKDALITDINYQNSAETARNQLLEHFEAHTKALLTDKSSSVRRALLGSVSSLCVFFGTTRANDMILSHLNTYMNDKDWMLRAALLHTIVGVATFVGGASLEEYILPLMVQALSDPEDFVVRAVLTSFAEIADLGLFQRSTTWHLVDIASRFMLHPNIWIREAAVQFIAASNKYVSLADSHCIIGPLLQPFLKIPLSEYSELNILDALKSPLPYSILEMTIIWATKAKKSSFWQPSQRTPQASSILGDQFPVAVASTDLVPKTWKRLPKSFEDEQWIRRLVNIGFSADDEVKALALKDYIRKLAPKRAQAHKHAVATRNDTAVMLKDLDVSLQTVFFEQRPSKTHRRVSHLRPRSTSRQKEAAPDKPHSIADALLDASTSIDDNRNRRRASQQVDRTSHEQHSGLLDPARRASSAGDLSFASSSAQARSVPRRGTPSDGTSTPTGSLKAGVGSAQSSVRHKSSAMNLLYCRDNPKAAAEIGMDNANAVGHVNATLDDATSTSPPKDGAGAPDRRAANTPPVVAGHTYGGNDPAIWKLLDSLAQDSLPREVLDFGSVTPINARVGLKRADSFDNDRAWSPQGVLVATFGEHKGAINRVLPAPDHNFFITGSDDGTVKVWDTFRLERNLAHRSRQTFVHAENAHVKGLCFVENTHTFVSAATDGTVKAVKVDHSFVTDNPKYGRLRLMREYRLRKGEYGVWLEHERLDSASLLLIATNMSRIIALDLKNMKEIYTLSNPVHHGTPTCFCVNHKEGWLVLGTSHGVLDLWDLRFQLRLKSWGLSGTAPIHSIIKSPLPGQSRRVCVTGGTGQSDMTLWDLERVECREIFRVGASKDAKNFDNTAYEVRNLEDDKPEGMLSRVAQGVGLLEFDSDKPDVTFRAVAGCIDDEEAWGGGSSHSAPSGFFLTGGADRKLRFWSWPDIDSSVIVSGLDVDESQPRYSTTNPMTGLTVHTELASSSAANASTDARGRSKRPPRKLPRNTVISLQQEALLRSHLDQISGVCILEAPMRMIVSVDKMGCIHVYQ